jgi:Prophage antirepressor
MTLATLQFENTHLNIINHSGETWLSINDVTCALYELPNRSKGGDSLVHPDFENALRAVRRVFQNSADEFTAQMTALVKLQTAGGEQEVRIFSLRGCHLLGLLARTKKAKAFRRWVLDILDGLTGEQRATGELIGLMRDLVQAQNKTLALVERLTQPRRSTRPPLDKDIPLILQLKAEGLPQAEIARQLKLSTAAVSLIVHGRYRVNDDSSVSLGATFS